MEPLKLSEIAAFCGDAVVVGNENTKITNICTDSRKITKDDAFLALSGDNFDGHDFIESCIKNGVKSFIVSKDISFPENINAVIVKDTNDALCKIALGYRKKFILKSVAVTGSVGKTTTKDIIAAVLSAKENVLKTAGNTNNHIGLPQNLLRLTSENSAMVMEMGMSGFSEISLLTSLVMPDIAVITNIGTSHIGNLGSRENILKAKLEILEGLSQNGTVILNGDDELLWALRGKLPFETIYYGTENKECDMFAETMNCSMDKVSFTCDINGKEEAFSLPVGGEHNVKNALCAVKIGLMFNMSCDEIRKGLMSYIPYAMRMNVVKSGGVTVVMDCYNSSLDSLKASLKTFKTCESKKKIAILGPILETGAFEEKLHVMAGEEVFKNNMDFLITLGREGRFVASGAISAGMAKNRVFSFDTKSEINEFCDTFIKDGDAVLLKASRGIALEDVGNHIIQKNQ